MENHTKPNINSQGEYFELSKPKIEINILYNRYFNKGTAFTMEEREQLGITALLPPRIESIEEQISRIMYQFKNFDKPINKYQFLSNLYHYNATLFYAVLCKYPEQMLPIVYTPTVGEACQKFGAMYLQERGFYLASSYKNKFRTLLQNNYYNDVDIIVVTDGSRILGLGDLGANGMGISIGKCSLYVIGGGILPKRALPILLDVGTNNKTLLADKHYLGQRMERVNNEEFYAVLDEFMDAASFLWPKAVIQFEDFSNNHCFEMLKRYQKKYRCFNDDIQGTGAVVSAGFVNAIKQSGIEPSKHRIVVFGAGSAAVGVTESIIKLISKIYKMAENDVKALFYLIDTKGLVSTTRGDVLDSHKVPLARNDIDADTSKTLKSLLDVIKFVKPTVFIGLGGVGPVLTQEMVEIMLQASPKPIIFPLSNPTSKSEINPADAYKWTNGTAIIASGSPYPEVSINNKICKPSQGNNMYVFPGLGLGAVIAQPKYISDELLLTAAVCLHNLVSENDLKNGALYPPLNDIRNVSKHIAANVIIKCVELGLCEKNGIPTNFNELLNYIEKFMWEPAYAPPGYMNKI